ncbi:Golgi-Associated Kinase 1B [Manis pentadactyla]|nr:Golgi-Associated Kinase 1B [Manis pentadactyla]
MLGRAPIFLDDNDHTGTDFSWLTSRNSQSGTGIQKFHFTVMLEADKDKVMTEKRHKDVICIVEQLRLQFLTWNSCVPIIDGEVYTAELDVHSSPTVFSMTYYSKLSSYCLPDSRQMWSVAIQYTVDNPESFSTISHHSFSPE